MKLNRIDHFVLTVKSIKVTCAFYEKVLGMKTITFGNARKALTFGSGENLQKINLHEVGKELEPREETPTSGSGDFCLIADTPMDDIIAHLNTCDVEIEEDLCQELAQMGRSILSTSKIQMAI